MTDYDYEIKESDIDWNAVALSIFEKLGIDGFNNAALTRLDGRVEHYYRNSLASTDVRIEVTGDEFKIFKIYEPWNKPEPELLKEGRLSDISLFSIERYLNSALRHGADSEPDHEVGDLQDYLRSMWEILTPEQKLKFIRSESVLSTLEAAEGDDPREALHEVIG